MSESMTYEIAEQYIQGDFLCVIMKVKLNSPPRPNWWWWNGYLAIPNIHPWYGKHTDYFDDIYVHGGITFAAHERNYHEYNHYRMDLAIKAFDLDRQGDKEGALKLNEESDKLPKYLTKEPSDPYPVETGLDLWWIGFDTNHYDDTDMKTGECRHPIDYPRGELEYLATQAADAYRKEQGPVTQR